MKAAQRAIETENVDLVLICVQKKDDVQSGRLFVKAYVEFLHYVEGLYQTSKATEHDHSHESKTEDIHA